MPTLSWLRLSIPGTNLLEARLECHYAVQINTRLARGFITAKDDDSHTSLSWEPRAGALIGEPLVAFRLGLRISNLTLLLLGPASEEMASCSLDGQTVEDALRWLSDHLQASRLHPTPLSLPIHLTLDDHPLLHGGRFRLRGMEPLFDNWLSGTAMRLSV
jgi:hypothetical protein